MRQGGQSKTPPSDPLPSMIRCHFATDASMILILFMWPPYSLGYDTTVSKRAGYGLSISLSKIVCEPVCSALKYNSISGDLLERPGLRHLILSHWPVPSKPPESSLPATHCGTHLPETIPACPGNTRRQAPSVNASVRQIR